MAKTSKQTEKMAKKLNWKRYLLVTLATVLLMTASLTVWIRNNVYNSERFSNTVVTAITSESSRSAIASEVTDKVFAGRPIAGRVLTSPTQSLIESLLNNDRFQGILTTVATKVNQRITKGNPQPIVIDISSFTNVITTVKQVIAPDADFTVPTGDAAKITLLKADALPDIHRAGQFLLVLLPATLLALAAIAVAGWFTVGRKATWFKLAGSVMLISSVVLLAFNFSGGPLLASFAQDSNQSIVLQNIYNAFTANFEHFQYLLGGFGIVLVAFGYSLERRNWPADVLASIKRAINKPRSSTAVKAK